MGREGWPSAFFIILEVVMGSRSRREEWFQRGCRDRDAGLLPRSTDSAYWDGYRSGRPLGLDEVIRYFPTLESFLAWRARGVQG